MLFVSIRGAGTELYQLACQLDLAEIVSKWTDSGYEDNERRLIRQEQESGVQSEGRTGGFV
jgi:hypothetical protein